MLEICLGLCDTRHPRFCEIGIEEKAIPKKESTQVLYRKIQLKVNKVNV